MVFWSVGGQSGPEKCGSEAGWITLSTQRSNVLAGKSGHWRSTDSESPVSFAIIPSFTVTTIVIENYSGLQLGSISILSSTPGLRLVS